MTCSGTCNTWEIEAITLSAVDYFTPSCMFLSSLHLSPLQTDVTLLDIACCVHLQNGQTFDPATPNISFVPWSPKRSATMLDLFAQLFPTLLGPCSQTRQSHMVSNISSPRCTAGPKIWKLFHLHTIAHTEGSNNSLLPPFAHNVSRLQKFFR